MEKVTENSSFMYTIWLVLALICMGYYIVCATYAGVGSSFIFIWLLGAVFFGLVFAVRVLEIKGIIHVAKVLRICFIVIMATGASLFIFIEALIIKGMMAKPKDNCDYIIVLGCQIIHSSQHRRVRKTDAPVPDSPPSLQSLSHLPG